MSRAIARSSERAASSVVATVKFKGNNNEGWKEITEVISFSRNGAGFFLQRECQIGRLVSIIITLPKHLRCYDENKEFYRIWGLVQNCSRVVTENHQGYHVGIVFIGKDAPESYQENPSTSYKICGMSNEGLWLIKQTEKPFIVRKHPRFASSLDVWLELLDAEGEDEFTREKTITENISISGASVFSDLDLKIDDCLTFTSKSHDFSALAVVRGKKTGEKGRPRIHLEFVNAKFTVEKLTSVAKIKN